MVLVRILNAHARRVLHKLLVNTRDERGDDGFADDRVPGPGGVQNARSTHHRAPLAKPCQLAVTKRVVDASKLCIDLARR
jgi:hypothetical protein